MDSNGVFFVELEYIEIYCQIYLFDCVSSSLQCSRKKGLFFSFSFGWSRNLWVQMGSFACNGIHCHLGLFVYMELEHTEIH